MTIYKITEASDYLGVSTEKLVKELKDGDK